MQMVNIGTNMCISSDEIESIMDPKSVMVKRMIDQYKNKNRLFDATRGKKTLSVIFTKRGNAYLTTFKVDTLKERFNKACEPFKPESPKKEATPAAPSVPLVQQPQNRQQVQQGQQSQQKYAQRYTPNYKQNQNGNFRRN